ncbi:MAG: hypothetical protein WBM08_14010 [Prochlorococcaceae cyanobacterium]
MPLQIDNPFMNRGGRQFAAPIDPGSVMSREEAPYAAFASLAANARNAESNERQVRTQATAAGYTQALSSLGAQGVANTNAAATTAQTSMLGDVRRYEADRQLEGQRVAYKDTPGANGRRWAGAAITGVTGLAGALGPLFVKKPAFELPSLTSPWSSGSGGSSVPEAGSLWRSDSSWQTPWSSSG